MDRNIPLAFKLVRKRPRMGFSFGSSFFFGGTARQDERGCIRGERACALCSPMLTPRVRPESTHSYATGL